MEFMEEMACRISEENSEGVSKGISVENSRGILRVIPERVSGAASEKISGRIP